jgi:acylphosphatase
MGLCPGPGQAMSLVCKHLLVEGLVQGVAFRYCTLRTAAEQQVTGWVRNLRDGRVEVLVEGELHNVERLVAWCADGPDGASVEQVTVTNRTHKGKYQTFQIETTAHEPHTDAA